MQPKLVKVWNGSEWVPVPVKSTKFELIGEIFTASGSWLCPAGVRQIIIECWGAGGAGGGRTASGGAAGGGGGAYAKKNVVSVTPGLTYNFTVGLGGVGNLNDVGQNGGDTFWDSGSLVKAVGGKGAFGVVGSTLIGGAGGLAGDCIGDVAFSGGTGGNGDSGGTLAGGGGGGAGSTQNGGDGGNFGGAGGTGGAEGGGNGGTWSSSSNGSQAGFVSGGGGSGARRETGSVNGGNGARGQIRITEFKPVPAEVNVQDYLLEETFTASGSWTAPVGVNEVQVECWAGGGGGGARTNSPGSASSGGGGAYARKRIQVDPLTVYNFIVGAGGSGAVSEGVSGQNGGDTYWNDGSEVKAAGGKGASPGGGNPPGPPGNGGSVDDSIGTTKYAGGRGGFGANGSAGTFPPGGGGAAGSTQAGGDGGNSSLTVSGLGGTGGIEYGGVGGYKPTSSNGKADGSLYGGGGTGANRVSGAGSVGGNGASGLIRIRYGLDLLSLEPEVTATLSRMAIKPTPGELKDYDVIIKSIKVGQGLTLGINNLSSRFRVFYINAAHNKQAQLLNWAQNSNDKTEVGDTIFIPFLGVKSDGSSYNNLNFSLPTANIEHAIGSYMVEATDNAAYAIGRNDNLNRGPRITFSSVNQSWGARDVALTSATGAGTKRHITVRKTNTSVNGPTDLWINGVSSDTDTDGGMVGGALYELCRNNNSTPTDFFTNLIAFTYVSAAGQVLNPLSLHNSLKDYLVKKGVTGL